MPRRPSSRESSHSIRELREFLDQFESKLNSENDLRTKVLAFIPVVNAVRDLGISLIPRELASASRDRILVYFQHYPQIIIHETEILVVAGISEWARRLRELRVEFGWKIVSGSIVRAMIEAGELEHKLGEQDLSVMRTNDYILLNSKQDQEAAYRWNIANEIRQKKIGVRDKILEYFLANVGKRISGEELVYLAKNTTEWARRVRELRTEYGWPIFTKQSGRPDLNVGEYVLEADRQSYVHDRKIPDEVRRIVLQRDSYSCTNCGWNHSEWNNADPRFLELHHLKKHVEGGINEESNLITLCNRCHDNVHAKEDR